MEWVDAERGRKDRYRAAQEAAGHFFASRAVDTAQNADPATVNVSRLQVDTDKWIASKLNQQYDVRQKDIAINISVNDLHAQAAQLLGDVDDIEDAEIVDTVPPRAILSNISSSPTALIAAIFAFPISPIASLQFTRDSSIPAHVHPIVRVIA